MPDIRPTCRWRLPAALPPAAVTLAAGATGIPELAAELLIRRGLATPEAMLAFLEPSAATLIQPSGLPDIDAATARLAQAVERSEAVLVYGDYDVDGVTSTALLTGVLLRLGVRAGYCLPRRDVDGYGFSPRGIEAAGAIGASLIITVDCGSSDSTTIAAARDAGIDVIVTDHHEVPNGLTSIPGALAFVSPKRADSRYRFRELAGVGVAFKLAWSLLAALGRPKDDIVEMLDLVGLGTIADVVPLTDENRVLARLGLLAIRSSRRPGLRALLKSAAVTGPQITSRHVGFALAPRINAAGRVADATTAVRLLLTTDPDEAATIAAELCDLNRVRQRIEETTLAAALSAFEQQNRPESRTAVVAGIGWHEGVLGIVASRLTEKLARPSVVISLRPDRGRGSGRSVPGFDLHSALSACAAHLTGFGGHRGAAGVTLPPDRVDAFREALSEHAAGLDGSLFEPTLDIDCVTPLDAVEETLLATFERFEPFGQENRPPLLATLGVEVVGCPRKAGRDHLLLRLRAGDRVLDAVAWRRGADLLNIVPGPESRIDVCYTIERRSWRGRDSLRLTLRDLRTAEAAS